MEVGADGADEDDSDCDGAPGHEDEAGDDGAELGFVLLGPAESINSRSLLAKGTMLVTLDSKSKSKPSIAASSKGRGTLEAGLTGPKTSQTFWAAATAASAEGKPPSV